MNEGLFQAQLSICDNSQDNNQQDNIKKQSDQLVFNIDRSINFQKSVEIAQISNDEKYLVILRQERKIKICYLKNKKLIKFIKLDHKQKKILIIKFSNNSRYLLFGNNYGYLGCFDISKNYKLIYLQRVHSKSIKDLLSLDDDQILTCSNDRSLIITNIQNDQQLLKIENAHTNVIEGIEFDKSNNFIISCSYDCSIKFFSRIDGKLQIEQKNDNQNKSFSGMCMVQLLSDDNNLISSTQEQLVLWLIDYQSLRLIKLKEFNNKIYNFSTVFNNNKIVVICDKCVQILDKDLIVLQSINNDREKMLCIYQIL